MKTIVLCLIMGLSFTLACKPKNQSNRHTKDLLEKEDLTDAELAQLEHEAASLEDEAFKLTREAQFYSSAEQQAAQGNIAGFEEAAGKAGFGMGSDGDHCNKICQIARAAKSGDKGTVQSLSQEGKDESSSKREHCLGKLKAIRDKILKCRGKKGKNPTEPIDLNDDKDTAYPSGGKGGGKDGGNGKG